MAPSDFIRFLVAVQADPDLQNALRRESAGLRTSADLVAFAARHGFHFRESDVPLPAACAA